MGRAPASFANFPSGGQQRTSTEAQGQTPAVVQITSEDSSITVSPASGRGTVDLSAAGGGGPALSNTVVGPDAFTTPQAPGAALTASRGDHDHGLPTITAADIAGAAATTVTGPDAYGDPSVVGASDDYARADHDHGLPGAPPPAFYASLTGAGETVTPGSLFQQGGFAVDVPPANASGIELLDQGPGGIQMVSTNGFNGIRIRTAAPATGLLDISDTSGAGGLRLYSAGLVSLAGDMGINISCIAGVPGSFLDFGASGISMGAGNIEIGNSPARQIGLYGAFPVPQPAAIPPPAGGAIVDVEARAAIALILNALGAAAGGIGLTA